MPRGAEEDHTFALIVRVGHCVVGQRSLTHPAVVHRAHVVSSSSIQRLADLLPVLASQCARVLQIGLNIVMILKSQDGTQQVLGRLVTSCLPELSGVLGVNHEAFYRVSCSAIR